MAVKRNSFLVDFGANLRRARSEAGLSQEALAAKARLHQVTVSLIENGRRAVTLTTMEKLARAIGIEPRELVPRLRSPGG